MPEVGFIVIIMVMVLVTVTVTVIVVPEVGIIVHGQHGLRLDGGVWQEPVIQTVLLRPHLVRVKVRVRLG